MQSFQMKKITKEGRREGRGEERKREGQREKRGIDEREKAGGGGTILGEGYARVLRIILIIFLYVHY